MGGFVLAWLTGESIVLYRWSKAKAPPPPGAFALSSVLFVGLAVIAQYQPARTTATVFAWAVDLAILLQITGNNPQPVTGWPPALINDPSVILPGGTSSQSGSSSTAAKPKSSGSPASSIISDIWNWLK